MPGCGVMRPQAQLDEAEEPGNQPVRGAERAAFIIAILAVLAFGSLNLFLPFTGDTALFSLGAQAIDQGDVLYVDFWDNKQPGIYWFFLAAGRTFGFDETGVRMFELLWLLAFTVIGSLLLRAYFRTKWLASVAIAVPVCSYLAVASPWMATQVESLVAGPTLLSMLALMRRSHSRGRNMSWLVLAGVFAAVTVVFKLAFAPLFIVLVLWASALTIRAEPRGWRAATVFRMWAAFTGGVAAVLGLVGCVFLATGGLNELLWTSFIYPGEAISNSEPAPYRRLLGVGWQLFVVLGPWSPAILASFWGWRGSPTRSTPRRTLIQLMWLWLICGMAVLLVQRFSWWPYHATVLFYPGCILAVCGVDTVAERMRRNGTQPRRVLLIVTATLLPAILFAGLHAQTKVRNFINVVRSGDDQWRYGTDSDEYRDAIAAANAFRKLQPGPGKIYVFGNPLIYHFANRTQALAVHGWSWEFFIDEQWRALPDELASRKPAYIFISEGYFDLVRKRSPDALELLKRDYEEVARTESGSWLQVRPL